MSTGETEPTLGPELPPLAPIRREGYFGGAGLLAADARVASLFADEARRRTMQRLFGIPKADKSGLATLIALLTLVEGTQRRMEGVKRPSPPTPIGVMFGIGLVKEGAYAIAGPWARESPYFGTLLAFALIGTSARFVVRKSTREAGALARKGFHQVAHRYGHLVLPNRPRPEK
jgi:hypothetical protein